MAKEDDEWLFTPRAVTVVIPELPFDPCPSKRLRSSHPRVGLALTHPLSQLSPGLSSGFFPI